MSEYNFNTNGGMAYSGGNPEDGQNSGYGDNQEREPKWFRSYMDKANQQIAELNSKLEAAAAKERQQEIAAAFVEKGYAPGAAALYQGQPDQVDAWLEQHGAALARTGQQQQDTRPPGDVAPQQPGLDASAQANLQKMQQAGMGSTAPGGSSDDDLAAALRATNSPEEFVKVAQAHGWQYGLGNMGHA